MKIREKDFDLKRYLQILGRRKILLLLPLMIVFSSGVFASFRMKPTYLSSTIILMRETRLLSRSMERACSISGYSRRVLSLDLRS